MLDDGNHALLIALTRTLEVIRAPVTAARARWGRLGLLIRLSRSVLASLSRHRRALQSGG